jgi:peptidyl-tRNA hydrolase, PTH1 family
VALGSLRKGTPADYVVVGLGNPGDEFAHTRHNVGADVVTLLATRHGVKLKAGKERSIVAEARFGPALARVVLAVPVTFMNLSGEAAGALLRRFGVDDVTRLIVVHDELDLEPGVLRVKSGGGLAGHNGLKSIVAHVHSDAFARVRIGVGKPPGSANGADYVLKRPSKADREALAVAIERAADAVETMAIDGIAVAMNRFN